MAPMSGSLALPLLVLLAWNGPQDPKAPVPGTSDREKVRKEIRELFKAEYGDRDPAVRAALASDVTSL